MPGLAFIEAREIKIKFLLIVNKLFNIVKYPNAIMLN